MTATTADSEDARTIILAALLGCALHHERIVCVEEGLRPAYPHVVRLPALVRQALQMRPDRLMVGEVHGAEAHAVGFPAAALVAVPFVPELAQSR